MLLDIWLVILVLLFELILQHYYCYYLFIFYWSVLHQHLWPLDNSSVYMIFYLQKCLFEMKRYDLVSFKKYMIFTFVCKSGPSASPIRLGNSILVSCALVFLAFCDIMFYQATHTESSACEWTRFGHGVSILKIHHYP